MDVGFLFSVPLYFPLCLFHVHVDFYSVCDSHCLMNAGPVRCLKYTINDQPMEMLKKYKNITHFKLPLFAQVGVKTGCHEALICHPIKLLKFHISIRISSHHHGDIFLTNLISLHAVL